jgi:GNAT superfamily N-acetyltransferase
MVEIRPCTVADIRQAANLPALLAEYAEEGAIKGMPAPAAQFDLYEAMESVDHYYAIAAYIDGLLIGFVGLMSSVLPHYGARITTTESFFVARAHRGSGAGLSLLHAAENYARLTDSAGILVSAPTGGQLEKLLPELKYLNTNTVFFKGFPCE